MLIIACCRLQYERTARPGALAAGKDALRLQSRVQLLDDDYMGMYQIGGLHVYACSIPATAPCLAILHAHHTQHAQWAKLCAWSAWCSIPTSYWKGCHVTSIIASLKASSVHKGESKQSAVSMQARCAL